MAEALGVLGVALQLTKIAKKLLRFADTYNNAPQEIRELALASNEFSSLFDKFEELTMDRGKGKNSVQRSNRDKGLIRLIRRRCRFVCTALNKLLECLRKFGRGEGIAGKLQSIYESFKWYFKQPVVRALQAAVEAAKSSLNAFSTMDMYTVLLKELEDLKRQNLTVPSAILNRM